MHTITQLHKKERKKDRQKEREPGLVYSGSSTHAQVCFQKRSLLNSSVADAYSPVVADCSFVENIHHCQNTQVTLALVMPSKTQTQTAVISSLELTVL